ncbi:dihydroxyacetone kinase family protein [Microbacterium sp. MPKO10]|uniref:dihydroxyacetone kinase family protein n=1 Tax=Microbacterium sp. MPKO10 TaxID=2989818 RepID=UPI0022355696|nr:dihydroxyacetone kinase family protein [Microbacterium sp. MPKO10]MCW4459912.1 dihydroxyacetone kinase family protein [Microbacterium sp. MPKO10]
MRKIINSADDFVDEVLDGILLAHGTRLRAATSDRRALVRADAPAEGRVGIVTGGGSGHLPFFLGYVGTGLCSAVAVGNVFSSPSSAQIHAASVAVSSGAGLLYLYGNYGGDVYNFDMAADLCRSAGIEVRTVLGIDDIESAPAGSEETRRGVAGLVLVYKAAGAAAERLYDLDDVERVARKAVESTRTMGVGLSPTVLPAAGEETFSLDDGEMEIGVGIHGEKGTHRGPLETADQITDRFIAQLETELELTDGARVAVLVNGLGSTPLEELYVVYRRVHRVLAERGVTIAYKLIGEYVTSLEMAGASLSIMQLDDELEELLHDPAASPFFQQGAVADIDVAPTSGHVDAGGATAVDVGRTGTRSVLRDVLLSALPRMSAHTDELRDLDAALGDGDLGITVSAGSDAVIGALEGLPEDADARSILTTAGLEFAAANPSTFAALLGNGLIGAAEIFEPQEDLTSGRVSVVVRAVVDPIAESGGAHVGDKTLLDVLDAVAAALEQGATPERAVGVARATVESTTQLQSKRGRAAWQQERSIGQADPGSVAVLRFIDEIVRAATTAR